MRGVARDLSNTIIRREYHEQRARPEKRREKETHEDPNGKKGGEESQEREQRGFEFSAYPYDNEAIGSSSSIRSTKSRRGGMSSTAYSSRAA